MRGSVAVGVSLAALLGATACLPGAERIGATRVDIGEPPTTASGSAPSGRLFPGFDITSEVKTDSTPFAVGKPSSAPPSPGTATPN